MPRTKFTLLAIALLQYSMVLSTVIPSEYLDIRDFGISNTTIEKRALDLSEIAMLHNLQNVYKGVWWATAYPNAERPYGSKYDVSCDNYIAPIGGRCTSSKDSQATEASIRHSMLSPSRFPLDGAKESRRRNTVTHQFKDPETLPANANGCSRSDVHAYTIDPKWTPNFTDLFDTIDDHLPKRKFMQGDKMNINQNIAANVKNYFWYLVDKMYGEQWGCAGKGTAYPGKLPESGLNRMIRQADIQATVENLDLGDESTDPATLPKAVWPANFHGEGAIDADDTSAIICDYVIPLDDESSTSSAPGNSASSTSAPVVTLPPDPKNCSYNEDGCTKESPACCDNGTC